MKRAILRFASAAVMAAMMMAMALPALADPPPRYTCTYTDSEGNTFTRENLTEAQANKLEEWDRADGDDDDVYCWQQ